MGKKGSWFAVVKKALNSDSREKKKRKSKGWFGRQKSQDFDAAVQTEPVSETPAVTTSTEEEKKLIEAENEQNNHVYSVTEEEKKLIEAENEQNNHVYSVALATAAAAEAAVAAAKAAAEVVRLTNVVRYNGKSKEEMAAVKIQTAFRGHMARRAFRALKGLVRLKTMIQGQSVKRQATVTLKCMQTLAHVQSEIRARRIRMSEENESLQRQLQQKHEKEIEKMRASIADNWNSSTRSKEQVEAKLQTKQEAANRRERALAYSYTHQRTWRNTPKSTQQTFTNPNPQWGWSWLERWMASRPWEANTATEKEPNSEHGSIKTTTSRAVSVAELQRAQSFRDDSKPSPSAHRQSRPPSRQSPSSSTPHSKTLASPMGAGKLRSPSSTRRRSCGMDDDSQSMCSAQSEYHHRRHSIAGSSMRDDESLASSPAAPNYLSPTKSTKARSRQPSPLSMEKNGTPDRGSVSSTKKRLSFSGSPAATRRYSGPPKIDTASLRRH